MLTIPGLYKAECWRNNDDLIGEGLMKGSKVASD